MKKFSKIPGAPEAIDQPVLDLARVQVERAARGVDDLDELAVGVHVVAGGVGQDRQDGERARRHVHNQGDAGPQLQLNGEARDLRSGRRDRRSPEVLGTAPTVSKLLTWPAHVAGGPTIAVTAAPGATVV